MTTVATRFDEDELAELDELRRAQGTSRPDTIRAAVLWYARWSDRLPDEEPDDEGL